MRLMVIGAACLLAGCAPLERPVKGSSLVLDLSPVARPMVVGSYDFDLLGSGAGKACLSRGGHTAYWIGVQALDRLSSDPLTRNAIAAAALDAISRLDETVDSIVLTSVVATASDARTVCATVKGRGVRLTKAKPEPPPETKKPDEKDENDAEPSADSE